jgi:DNA-binding MarR family transcriptional regulator
MSARRSGGRAREPRATVRVASDEVLHAAEFRRLLRRFLAHGDAAARRVGLTPQRYLLLLVIKGAPDRSETRSIGQLCDDLQLAQSSVSELVDRAEAAGLVARSATNGDARVLVRLTPRGEDRFQAGLSAVRAERHQLLKHLDRARHHLSDEPSDVQPPP